MALEPLPKAVELKPVAVEFVPNDDASELLANALAPMARAKFADALASDPTDIALSLVALARLPTATARLEVACARLPTAIDD